MSAGGVGTWGASLQQLLSPLGLVRERDDGLNLDVLLVDDADVDRCDAARRDAEVGASAGHVSAEEVQEKRFAHAAALVYARVDSDSRCAQGVAIFQQLIAQDYEVRDALYLVALGLYRRGRHAEARTEVKALLGRWPESLQAQKLLEAITAAEERDELLATAGTAAAVAAGGLGVVALALLSASARPRR